MQRLCAGSASLFDRLHKYQDHVYIVRNSVHEAATLTNAASMFS